MKSFSEKLQYDQYNSYGDISWELERAHLDNFALFLQGAPDSKGYIIVYAGQRACVGEAQNRASRAKRYLIQTRGILESRLVPIDGGYRKKLTVVLQPVPLDAPKYTPFPTVEPSKAKIIKCRSRESRHRKHTKTRIIGH
jgi:hypothetical protein